MIPEMLVTGIGSGIGLAAHRSLGGLGLSRQNASELLRSVATRGVKVIVHCAFNSRRDPSEQEMEAYRRDNIELTRNLLSVPHQKFIYFSTADLYSTRPAREFDPIHPAGLATVYARTKHEAESLVRETARNCLVLRPTSLVGPTARENNLSRLLRDPVPKLTLTAGSRLNLVRHDDVISFIRRALEQDLTGIFNLASTGGITLDEIAQLLSKKPVYGEFHYDVGEISNEKALAICPEFGRSSREILQELIAS